MSLDQTLSWVAAALRLALSGLILALLFRHGRLLQQRVFRVWVVLGTAIAFSALGNLFTKVWRLVAGADLPTSYRLFYNWHVFGNASFAALVPIAAVALLARDRRVRRAGWAVAGLLGAYWVSAWVGTGFSVWDQMIDMKRPVDLAALGMFALVILAALLGWLADVDRFLFGFIGVWLLFQMLVPINEVFFQAVGEGDAGLIWRTQFVMMVSRYAIQVGIVAFLLRHLARGRQLRPLGARRLRAAAH